MDFIVENAIRKEGMSFNNAILAMKGGNIVEVEDLILRLKDGQIIGAISGTRYYLNLRMIESNDWKIYKEKKTLRDKMVQVDTDKSGVMSMGYESDIKKTLNDFENSIFNEHGELQINTPRDFQLKVKKVFGESFIS